MGCSRQAALERQDLSCTYLAHHELESILVTIVHTIAHDGLGTCRKSLVSAEQPVLGIPRRPTHARVHEHRQELSVCMYLSVPRSS